jgi:hypothetical protein
LSWRIEWCRSAFATQREAPKGTSKVKCNSPGDEQKAGGARDVQVQPHAAGQQPIGHRDGPKTRDQNGENQRSNKRGHQQERTPVSLFAVEVAEAVGEDDVDTAGSDVDADADVFSEGNEQFPVRSVHREERRAGDTFADELDIADSAEK